MRFEIAFCLVEIFSLFCQQFLQSHSVVQDSLHDFLNEESSKGASPHKKARLSDLNKRWHRIRAILESRKRKLRALGVIASEPQAPSKVSVVEAIIPEREHPVLASSPGEEKKPSTPSSKPTTPVRESPVRELKTPPSGDKKSPKTKKNQYEEELKEFSEWLTSQEKAFHELVSDENLPPTMEALKDRLKQFQVQSTCVKINLINKKCDLFFFFFNGIFVTIFCFLFCPYLHCFIL